MKEWLQYAVAWTLIKMLGVLPRAMARGIAATGARLLLFALPKLKKTAEFNLRLAFPEWTDAQRRATLRKMTRNLGWMAAEFARLPEYTKENIESVVILDGHENFLAGHSRGKGVLYLTGHIGAWELSSFAHALVWISAALHGAAVGQQAAGCAGESIPRDFRGTSRSSRMNRRA